MDRNSEIIGIENILYMAKPGSRKVTADCARIEQPFHIRDRPHVQNPLLRLHGPDGDRGIAGVPVANGRTRIPLSSHSLESSSLLSSSISMAITMFQIVLHFIRGDLEVNQPCSSE
jgi:hypothetical protein